MDTLLQDFRYALRTLAISPAFGASSYPDYGEFAKQSDVFSGVAAYRPHLVSVGEGTAPLRTGVQIVSGDYFRVLGVRAALGARTSDVLRLVLRRGLGLIAAALAGVRGTALLTFAGSSALLALVAPTATYLPARRAARVNPMVALRYE